MHELLIVGGGPAGAAAAVYAARKQLRSVIVTDTFGGQSIVSDDIQNWIGVPHMRGSDLAAALKAHVMEYKGEYLELYEGVRVEALHKNADGFTATLSSGPTLSAQTVLITAGAGRKKLTVPGAEKFDQKGLTYCATCDGPLFSGMDVAVIGGGNAGFETAAQLLAYCKSVTLLDSGGAFRADPITIKKVTAHENMKTISNALTLEITGDAFVSGLRYRDKLTEQEHSLAVQGIFVEIGMLPNTNFLHDLISLNDYGRVVVDPRTQATSTKGVWAAGDCTDALYHQNNIAAGDAVKAIEDIYIHLRAR